MTIRDRKIYISIRSAIPSGGSLFSRALFQQSFNPRTWPKLKRKPPYQHADRAVVFYLRMPSLAINAL